ncbi:hypothetical protein BJY01DRAFT_234348 [Aspergillus pseudoustus]|uniref:General substrate transporter n=1 Tax=Aspergillus pseudoustus TaxID=1810923 RepID=A0ABR4K4A4_9EURO
MTEAIDGGRLQELIHQSPPWYRVSIEVFVDYFGNPTGALLGFYGSSMSAGSMGGCLQLGAPVLDTELAHPKQRELLTSIYSTSIFVGLTIGAWITFATYQLHSHWFWRIPCLLQVTLPLIKKGRIQEARTLLINTTAMEWKMKLSRLNYRRLSLALKQIKPCSNSIKRVSRRSSALKGNPVASQCLGVTLVSGYLTLILEQIGMTSSHDKTLINGILSLWQWVCALSGAFIVPRIGRRPLFLGSTIGITASFIVWTALTATYEKMADPKRSYGIGVIVVISIFPFFNAIRWSSLVVTYTLETVTLKQRSIFFSFTMFCINASSFVAGYLNPVALDNIGWRYYICQIVFDSLVVVIIYFTFVGTRGFTLEEVAQVFDGKEDLQRANEAVSAALSKGGGESAHVDVLEKKV